MIMGQNLIQKILARASGKEEVKTGEIIFAVPHRILTHDNSAAISKTYAKIAGDRRVWDPERIFIALDHEVPPPHEKAATNHQVIREFVQEQGIEYFYEGGTGICHQVLPEEGHVKPSTVIFGSDSHTTTHGAFGAAGIPIGRTEAASIWAIGKTWLKVPESYKVNITGDLPRGVRAKDVILQVIKELTASGASYMSIEYHGSVIDKMTISERMTICNMAAEMGAKAGMVPTDNVTDEWLKPFNMSYEKMRPDDDATYEHEINFDVSGLEPLVARPHKVDNVVPVSRLPKTIIDVALLGTCTNGRLEDLREAAVVLKGQRTKVRLLVYPASRKIMIAAAKEGITDVLLEAGAQIAVPACGPCLGAYGGCLAPGERAISTANRNFKGRMGCKTDTEIYLASPATVAASAVAGQIVKAEE
ncbi:MAG: 3-isopropylmalate dehydratase large subunit [Candidatus Hodarchaeales archaeon]|jgi:3-isopropylmalate/(R)-2-methylmalate dehydratase large subunit